MYCTAHITLNKKFWSQIREQIVENCQLYLQRLGKQIVYSTYSAVDCKSSVLMTMLGNLYLHGGRSIVSSTYKVGEAKSHRISWNLLERSVCCNRWKPHPWNSVHTRRSCYLSRGGKSEWGGSKELEEGKGTIEEDEINTEGLLYTH